MAKKTSQTSVKSFIKKSRKKRPGVHAKCKNSVSKRSKNYKKKYCGQGR